MVKLGYRLSEGVYDCPGNRTPSSPLPHRLYQASLGRFSHVWDSKHGEHEPLMTVHRHEFVQLYVDIGLANIIIWPSTEIGHRSKDLDESYIKLCTGIAERIIDITAKMNNNLTTQKC